LGAIAAAGIAKARKAGGATKAAFIAAAKVAAWFKAWTWAKAPLIPAAITAWLKGAFWADNG
jgi:hypothetical protein